MAQEKAAARVLHFESIDSTNEEAMRQLASGSEAPLWIVAGEQSMGRGRAGRRWRSPKGNLYASLLLKLNISAGAATGLSFVAALAAYDAIASGLPPEQLNGLRLKWPNDVLLGGAKIAGILIESLNGQNGSELAAIIGIGINVSSAPSDTERPVAALGLEPSACASLFEALRVSFENWLIRWDEGSGFAAIREMWLARAHRLGEPVSVNLNGSSIRGRFCDVDERGALQLETAPGVVITISAGDIHPDAQG